MISLTRGKEGSCYLGRLIDIRFQRNHLPLGLDPVKFLLSEAQVSQLVLIYLRVNHEVEVMLECMEEVIGSGHKKGIFFFELEKLYSALIDVEEVGWRKVRLEGLKYMILLGRNNLIVTCKHLITKRVVNLQVGLNAFRDHLDPQRLEERIFSRYYLVVFVYSSCL